MSRASARDKCYNNGLLLSIFNLLLIYHIVRIMGTIVQYIVPMMSTMNNMIMTIADSKHTPYRGAHVVHKRFQRNTMRRIYLKSPLFPVTYEIGCGRVLDIEESRSFRCARQRNLGLQSLFITIEKTHCQYLGKPNDR